MWWGTPTDKPGFAKSAHASKSAHAASCRKFNFLRRSAPKQAPVAIYSPPVGVPLWHTKKEKSMPGSHFFALRRLFGRSAPRRLRAYCVGTAKSGTHSLGAIFERSYAAEHEAKHRPMIQAVLDRAAGKMDDAQAEEFIRRRDR